MDAARRLADRRPRFPRRFRARGRDVVVLYHRIAREPLDPTGMVVDPDRLRRQLEALREHFDVVPAAEVLQPARPGARARAAITFDDGYADNLHDAVPVLRDLGLPATLFVVTDVLEDRREFWWDRLEHLVLELLGPGPLVVRIGRRSSAVALQDAAARRRALGRLNQLLLRQPPDVVEAVLQDLQSRAGGEVPSCPRHRRLSAEQVVELAADPLLEIGSHTCTHSATGRLSRRACAKELVESRRQLERLTGTAPRLLAYPYGVPGTVRRRDARLAAGAGYQLAFSNTTGPVEGSSAHAVPRTAVGEWEPDDLLARITRWSPS